MTVYRGSRILYLGIVREVYREPWGTDDGAVVRADGGSVIRTDDGSVVRTDDGSVVPTDDGTVVRTDDGTVIRTVNRAGIGQAGIRTVIVNLGSIKE